MSHRLSTRSGRFVRNSSISLAWSSRTLNLQPVTLGRVRRRYSTACADSSPRSPSTVYEQGRRGSPSTTATSSSSELPDSSVMTISFIGANVIIRNQRSGFMPWCGAKRTEWRCTRACGDIASGRGSQVALDRFGERIFLCACGIRSRETKNNPVTACRAKSIRKERWPCVRHAYRHSRADNGPLMPTPSAGDVKRRLPIESALRIPDPKINACTTRLPDPLRRARFSSAQRGGFAHPAGHRRLLLEQVHLLRDVHGATEEISGSQTRRSTGDDSAGGRDIRR